MTRQASKSGAGRSESAPATQPAAHRRERSDDGNAFIPDPGDGPARTRDDLAENLAEGFLQSATSGESVTEEQNDEVVPEELGGPFVETSASEEFADGTDESNPADAEAAALPTTNGEMAASPEELEPEPEE
jgi:hypothetical protein